MLRKLICAFIILLIGVFGFLITQFLITNYSPSVLSKKTKKGNSPEINVVARVGKRAINRLTGFSSPYSEIGLSGQNLARKTTADSRGFFAFTDFPIAENLREICLLAQDVNQLPSFPTCLPLPDTDQNLMIDNVLLSPTLSLDGGQIPAGKTAKASGMTFPDAQVDVFLFTEQNWSIWGILRRLIRPVYALGLPRYQIKSNPNGYFEFSLPANSPADNGVFVAAAFPSPALFGLEPQSPPFPLFSPKSNTLFFQTVGLWGLIKLFLEKLFQKAGQFFLSLRSDWVIIIFIEVLILLGLIWVFLFKKNKEDARRPKT